MSAEAQVERKLQEALDSDIIEKVTTPSQWISPIVVVSKSNDDIRICIDMRRTNEANIKGKLPLDYI